MAETKAQIAEREREEALAAAEQAASGAQEGQDGAQDDEGGSDSPEAPAAAAQAPNEMIRVDVHGNLSLTSGPVNAGDKGVLVADDELTRSCIVVGHLSIPE